MPSSVFIFPGTLQMAQGSQVLVADGSAGAPSYSFASEPNTGWYHNGPSLMIFTAGGTTRAQFNGWALDLLSDTSSVLRFGVNQDVILSRGGAAGKLQLTGTTPMFQLGGTTSSFPALKQSGSSIQVKVADDSAFAPLGLRDLSTANATLLFSAAPTISSGFGSSPSIANNNGTGAFVVNVGTGGTATSGVIGLPAATTGWILHCIDITAAAGHTGLRTVQTASTTNSATIESQNSAGTATAWATGSLVRIIAMAY